MVGTHRCSPGDSAHQLSRNSCHTGPCASGSLTVTAAAPPPAAPSPAGRKIARGGADKTSSQRKGSPARSAGGSGGGTPASRTPHTPRRTRWPRHRLAPSGQRTGFEPHFRSTGTSRRRCECSREARPQPKASPPDPPARMCSAEGQRVGHDGPVTIELSVLAHPSDLPFLEPTLRHQLRHFAASTAVSRRVVVADYALAKPEAAGQLRRLLGHLADEGAIDDVREVDWAPAAVESAMHRWFGSPDVTPRAGRTRRPRYQYASLIDVAERDLVLHLDSDVLFWGSLTWIEPATGHLRRGRPPAGDRPDGRPASGADTKGVVAGATSGAQPLAARATDLGGDHHAPRAAPSATPPGDLPSRGVGGRTLRGERQPRDAGSRVAATHHDRFRVARLAPARSQLQPRPGCGTPHPRGRGGRLSLPTLGPAMGHRHRRARVHPVAPRAATAATERLGGPR